MARVSGFAQLVHVLPSKAARGQGSVGQGFPLTAVAWPA